MLIPSTLVKQLASVDKSKRDTAFQTLNTWILCNQAQMSELDMLKLCKAMYYSYWLSDKPNIQQDLARSYTNLTTLLCPSIAIRYLNAQWQIVLLEWQHLDKHRVDKYYYLLRQLHCAAFKVLQACHWDEQVLDAYSTMMIEGPLNATETRIPDSVRYHTIEVFIESLESVLERNVPQHAFTSLMVPYILLLGESRNACVRDRIQHHVLTKLITLVENESHLVDRSVEVILQNTYMQVFFPDIVSVMFDVAAHPETPAKNRRVLYKLVQLVSSKFNIKLVDTACPMENNSDEVVNSVGTESHVDSLDDDLSDCLSDEVVTHCVLDNDDDNNNVVEMADKVEFDASISQLSSNIQNGTDSVEAHASKPAPQSKSVQFRLDRNEVKPFFKVEPPESVAQIRCVKERFPAPELAPNFDVAYSHKKLKGKRKHRDKLGNSRNKKKRKRT